MITEIRVADAASIEKAALLLHAGEVVAFPTETVYGLGADALNERAVRRIFEAKARPADNPLIVHIASASSLPALVAGIPPLAERLIERFWPGPLTIILPKSKIVPGIVTAGSQTVAVRMPSHPAALALLRAVAIPIAAPSANPSGKPSPTTAEHVLSDLGGRIPLILDGGPCAVGLESTVLDLSQGTPTILRPGGVTAEMLREVCPDLRIDSAVLAPLERGEVARSPGMKHRHYAPSARVLVVRGVPDAVRVKASALYDQATANGRRAIILCATANRPNYSPRETLALGSTPDEMSARLFDALRELDRSGFELAIAEATGTEGLGLALMNRLLRAADFDMVEAEP